MEQQPKRKHTSTIIFFIILVLGIAAFVVIYFFGNDIKAGLSRERLPRQEAAYTEAPDYYHQTDPVWTAAPTLALAPETAPPATRPPATAAPYVPPATNPPAAPAGINVRTAFPGATIKETWVDKQWILTVPLHWSVTIPKGWIANTDPRRWTIVPMPDGYTGASGEIIPAGTYIQAMMAGDVYVRYIG